MGDGEENNTMVTAVFADAASAERAYQACTARGYAIGDVSIVMSEETRRRFLTDGNAANDTLAEKKAEGGSLGGPTGGRVGILISILAAVGAAVALPALGLVAAGPIAAAVAAGGAAGVAGGLIGALAHWGIPDARVRGYEGAIRGGGVLVAVKAHSEEDAREIEREWVALGGTDVSRTSAE